MYNQEFEEVQGYDKMNLDMKNILSLGTNFIRKNYLMTSFILLANYMKMNLQLINYLLEAKELLLLMMNYIFIFKIKTALLNR